MSDRLSSEGGLTCRAGVADDFDAIARLWHDSAGASDGAPPTLPSVADLRARIDHEIAAGWAITVALDGPVVVGFLALKPSIAALDQLFILPGYQGIGIGCALLDQAKRTMPGGFTLRTAAANERARRFYSRSGLTLLEEGRHPRSGLAVCYYGWNGGEA